MKYFKIFADWKCQLEAVLIDKPEYKHLKIDLYRNELDGLNANVFFSLINRVGTGKKEPFKDFYIWKNYENCLYPATNIQKTYYLLSENLKNTLEKFILAEHGYIKQVSLKKEKQVKTYYLFYFKNSYWDLLDVFKMNFTLTNRDYSFSANSRMGLPKEIAGKDFISLYDFHIKRKAWQEKAGTLSSNEYIYKTYFDVFPSQHNFFINEKVFKALQAADVLSGMDYCDIEEEDLKITMPFTLEEQNFYKIDFDVKTNPWAAYLLNVKEENVKFHSEIEDLIVKKDYDRKIEVEGVKFVLDMDTNYSRNLKIETVENKKRDIYNWRGDYPYPYTYSLDKEDESNADYRHRFLPEMGYENAREVVLSDFKIKKKKEAFSSYGYIAVVSPKLKNILEQHQLIAHYFSEELKTIVPDSVKGLTGDKSVEEEIKELELQIEALEERQESDLVNHHQALLEHYERESCFTTHVLCFKAGDAMNYLDWESILWTDKEVVFALQYKTDVSIERKFENIEEFEAAGGWKRWNPYFAEDGLKMTRYFDLFYLPFVGICISERLKNALEDAEITGFAIDEKSVELFKGASGKAKIAMYLPTPSALDVVKKTESENSKLDKKPTQAVYKKSQSNAHDLLPKELDNSYEGKIKRLYPDNSKYVLDLLGKGFADSIKNFKEIKGYEPNENYLSSYFFSHFGTWEGRNISYYGAAFLGLHEYLNDIAEKQNGTVAQMMSVLTPYTYFGSDGSFGAFFVNFIEPEGDVFHAFSELEQIVEKATLDDLDMGLSKLKLEVYKEFYERNIHLCEKRGGIEYPARRIDEAYKELALAHHLSIGAKKMKQLPKIEEERLLELLDLVSDETSIYHKFDNVIASVNSELMYHLFVLMMRIEEKKSIEELLTAIKKNISLIKGTQTQSYAQHVCDKFDEA